MVMKMNKKIKAAFNQIHAEKELKENTKAFLAKKTNGYRSKSFGMRRLFTRKAFIPAAVCLLFALLGLGGHRLYFMPVSFISIDINPSVELGINRFDRVISVEGYNDDGKELASSLDVRFLDYSEALQQIFENNYILSCFARDEMMAIVVIQPDNTQEDSMFTAVEACVAGHENTYCYQADYEDAKAAHDAGLTCGKYKACQEIQALAPEMTTEEIQSMTTREIHDLIHSLSGHHTEGEAYPGMHHDCGRTGAAYGNDAGRTDNSTGESGADMTDSGMEENRIEEGSADMTDNGTGESSADMSGSGAGEGNSDMTDDGAGESSSDMTDSSTGEGNSDMTDNGAGESDADMTDNGTWENGVEPGTPGVGGWHHEERHHGHGPGHE